MRNELKAFKTLDELIIKMKNREIIVDDSAKRKLYYDSHYSIVNGYKDLFIYIKRNDMIDDIYKKGTTFEEIYSLYNLDWELRTSFLKELMRAETFLKNVLCYEFYNQFGDGDSYLYLKNFNIKNYLADEIINRFKDRISAHINEYTDSRSKNKKHNAISYNNATHGFVPLWVLMRFLNFTDISKMYSALQHATQLSIINRVNSINHKIMPLNKTITYKHIRAFVVCRNICAHDNIFYSHEYWGGDKVFKIYSSLKYHIPPECYKDFTLSLKKIISDFRSKTPFKIISANQILNIMGFPDDWDLKV